jgi:hypothetical protein
MKESKVSSIRVRIATITVAAVTLVLAAATLRVPIRLTSNAS